MSRIVIRTGVRRVVVRVALSIMDRALGWAWARRHAAWARGAKR